MAPYPVPGLEHLSGLGYDDRPLLLDAYSCQGIGARGYAAAGWRVICVDNDPRNIPYLPFPSICTDAVAYIRRFGHLFDAIHASPPCQAHTRGNAGKVTKHVNLIPATRDALQATGRPYVIENVEHAAKHLREPALLCGSQFGLVADDLDGHPLALERHRLFETNWRYTPPARHEHDPERWAAGVYNGGRKAKRPYIGATPSPAQDRHAARYERHGGYVPRAHSVKRRLLGVPDEWSVTVKALTECLPPAYTEHIGRQLRAHVNGMPA